MQRFTKYGVRNNQLSEVTTKKCEIRDFMWKRVSVLRKKAAAVKVLIRRLGLWILICGYLKRKCEL